MNDDTIRRDYAALASKVETLPTPETYRRLHESKNLAVGGKGRMEKSVVGHKYRNHFELIADPDVDALPSDYTSSFSRLCAAKYAFLLSTKATAGWRADTANEGDSDGMPLADFYTALLKRFDEQKKAVYLHAGRKSEHWSMLEMLMTEIPDSCNLLATRNAMFALVPQITTALDLLEEYAEEIARAWKRANAPTAEEEHARR